MNDNANIAGEMSKVMQKYWGIIKVPHDQRAKEFVQDSTAGSVEVNDPYHYYQQGSGPVVMLVHGLHTNLGSLVGVGQELIRRGFRVVVFDAPAHGEAAGTQTDPVMVREVIRRISRDFAEIHAVVCHSIGGLWALAAWNDEFRAKTVVSLSAPSSHRFLVEKFVQLHQLRPQIAAGIEGELERRFGQNVWSEFSPAEIVQTIGVPGLILHGSNDDFVPPAHAQLLRSNWNQARVEMIAGAGHFDIVASPAVRQLVGTYLHESLR